MNNLFLKFLQNYFELKSGVNSNMYKYKASAQSNLHFNFGKIVRSQIFIFLLCSLASTLTHAQTPTNNSDTDRVRFANLELAPYGYRDETGVSKGYLYETTNLVLETAGYPADNIIFPVKRMIKSILSGDKDCSIVAETPFAKSNFQLIEKIGKKLEIGVLPRAGITVKNYADLYNHTIALPLGISLSSKFDSDEELLKIKTKGYLESVNMMESGRVETVAGALDSLRYNVRRKNLDPSVFFGTPYLFIQLDIWLACAPNRLKETTIKRLKNAVISLRESGKIQEIIDRYF